MTFLYVGDFVYILNFCCCIGTCAQYFSQWLHYVLIYVYYDEILFLFYWFKLVQQNPLLSCERLHMAGLDDCNIS
jgi:hypothetical protein